MTDELFGYDPSMLAGTGPGPWTDDLHAAINVALDREQAQANAALTTVDDRLQPIRPPTPWHETHRIVRGLLTSWSRAEFIAAQNPTLTLRRVEADRRVLARHWAQEGHDYEWCVSCRDVDGVDPPWPCPDVLDLAARYDVEVDQP